MNFPESNFHFYTQPSNLWSLVNPEPAVFDFHGGSLMISAPGRPASCPGSEELGLFAKVTSLDAPGSPSVQQSVWS